MRIILAGLVLRKAAVPVLWKDSAQMEAWLRSGTAVSLLNQIQRSMKALVSDLPRVIGVVCAADGIGLSLGDT